MEFMANLARHQRNKEIARRLEDGEDIGADEIESDERYDI